jgi:hypothetical protein
MMGGQKILTVDILQKILNQGLDFQPIRIFISGIPTECKSHRALESDKKLGLGARVMTKLL